MAKLKNLYKVVIGDWSDDGHGEHDEFTVEVNKKKLEIQEAYKSFVKRTGVSLDHRTKGSKYQVAVDYEDCYLTGEPLEILKKSGINVDNLPDIEWYDEDIKDKICLGPESVAHLFMEMVKVELPNFEYKFIEDKIEPLNGYWDKNLNVGLGYGCYH